MILASTVFRYRALNKTIIRDYFKVFKEGFLLQNTIFLAVEFKNSFLQEGTSPLFVE